MYSFDSRVRYSECDATGSLTLVALVNYLQDCSTFHSESIGHGVAFTRAHGFAWLIAAWQIEIRQLPRFCDPITVSTWCYGAMRTQASRNFAITAPDGSAYVRADSLWFAFDTAARRPMRVPEGELAYLDDTPRLDMPATVRKLAVVGEGVAAAPITVAAHHLDTNGHVNNAQYLAMAADAVAAAGVGGGASVAGGVGGGAVPRRICVQYKRMALFGDVIVPRVHVADNDQTVDLADPDGSTFAVVRFEC